MDDIKELSKEITDIGAYISDMLLSWCKERGHNPNFIFDIVGQELSYFQRKVDFSDYKPSYGGVILQMDNETLAQQIYDLSDAVKKCGYTEQEAVRKIFLVLESTFDEKSKL